MTECIHRSRLSDYLDGHLEPSAREAVRLHLESDPACGCPAELEALDEMVRELASLAPGPVPPGGWDRLEPALERPARGRGWRAAAAAAVLLTAAIAALYLPRRAGSPAPAAGPAADGTPSTGGPALTAPPQGRLFEGRKDLAPGGDVLHAVASANLLAAAARGEPPKVRLADDLVVRYGTEIAQVDRLTAVLRGLPGAADDPGVQGQIGRLESLRRDLFMELVLQAQARQAGPWR